MDLNGWNQKFVSYVILLISFFILLFFTKAFFYTLQEQFDEKIKNTKEFLDLKKEHLELEELQGKFSSNQDVLLKDISKYTIDFNSENLFNYIHLYVKDFNSKGKDSITIKGVNFSESSAGDLGFNEGTINITARFSSQRALLRFVSYFTSKDSQYTFFMDNFTYPKFGKEGSFQVTLPLKLFYKK